MFETRPINNLTELLKALADIRGSGQPTLWFRGQRDVSWGLSPSIARKGRKKESETALIKRFKQNAYGTGEALPTRDDFWAWLFLMQHNGAPTRLLDWSENPLVGLFFASEDHDQEKTDGCLWVLAPKELNKRAAVDSDLNGEFPYFGSDPELDAYTTEAIQLSGFKQSKPPIAAIAPRYFRRISAQSGVFTVSGRDCEPIEVISEGKCTGRLTIPHASKVTFRKELSLLGITKLTLYPELPSVAEYAKESTL